MLRYLAASFLSHFSLQSFFLNVFLRRHTWHFPALHCIQVLPPKKNDLKLNSMRAAWWKICCDKILCGKITIIYIKLGGLSVFVQIFTIFLAAKLLYYSTYMYVCAFIRPFARLSALLSVCVNICLYVCLSVLQFVCLSFSLSICPSVRLYERPLICWKRYFRFIVKILPTNEHPNMSIWFFWSVYLSVMLYIYI